MQRELHHLRKTYEKDALIESQITENPYDLFNQWFENAKEHTSVDEVNAMGLSTIGLDGYPKTRIVLLKEIDAGDFVFYTNYSSEKGASMAVNNKVSFHFFWPSLERQIIIKGTVEKVSREQSETYYRTRPRGSQIGAWASNQSSAVEDRAALDKSLEHFTEKFEGVEVPLPDFWGGYAVTPVSFEFWQGRPNRMHDRILYVLDSNEWSHKRLAP